MRLTRRGLATTAALALAAPRLARAAARQIGLAGPDGPFQPLFQSTIVDPWRRANGDPEVFYYPAGSSGQVLTQLRQQKRAPVMDVVLLDIETARIAGQEGLVEPLTPETMPVLHDLIPTARVPDLAGPVLLLDCLALISVPNLVKQDTGSWKLLWDGTIGRQVALAAPPDPIGFGFTLIADRMFGRADLSDGLKGGLNAIEQIAPRFVSWNPKPSVYDFMMDGNASLGIGWNAMGQVRARRAPGYLKAVIPREGSALGLHAVCLVKGARDPETARSFIVHALSPDAQRALAEQMYYTPVNGKVTVTGETASRVIATPAQMQRMIRTQDEAIARLRWPVTEQWRQRILRGRF